MDAIRNLANHLVDEETRWFSASHWLKGASRLRKGPSLPRAYEAVRYTSSTNPDQDPEEQLSGR